LSTLFLNFSDFFEEALWRAKTALLGKEDRGGAVSVMIVKGF
jgi:hypothetical protein